MRTCVRTLLIVMVVVLIGALVAVPVSAQESVTVYREGIEVEQIIFRRVWIGTSEIHLSATKHVIGGSRYTDITIRSTRHGGNIGDIWFVVATIDTTVRLPGDPDELEVSNDLGWGGLNGTVWVRETVTACRGYGTDCTTTMRMVPVTIHLSVYAFGAVEYDSPYYIREQKIEPRIPGQPVFSNVYGSITFPQGESFEFREMPVSQFRPESGVTFSSRAPFPDE